MWPISATITLFITPALPITDSFNNFKAGQMAVDIF